MKMNALVLAMAGLLAAPALFATEAPADAPMPIDRLIEHVDNRADLELTDAQKAQIRTIAAEQKAKHEAVRAETRNRVDGVLTPEQRVKLQQHREEVQERHADRLDKRAEKLEKRAEKVREKQQRSSGY